MFSLIEQKWYWSREWQDKERTADKELEAGKIHSADNIDDLMEHLEKD
jgi:hypothetical protein